MNAAAIRTDPVIAKAVARLRALYGERFDHAVLFGSRARGDHKANSDYDIAVYLVGYDYTMGEVFRLADISWDLQVETGKIVSFKPFPSGSGLRDSLLSREIARDGVAL